MANKITPPPASNNLPLIVIGAGGQATNVATIAIANGYDIKAFVDANKKNQLLHGKPIIASIEEIENYDSCFFCVAVGDNAIRQEEVEQLKEKYPHIVFPPLIQKSADVSSLSSIGEGSVLGPNTVVGGNTKVGDFCIFGTLSCIAHDGLMLSFSSLGTGAMAAGRVSIGIRTAICMGVMVKGGIRIGNDCVVGANSYLNKDLPDNQVAYGTPAKVIRSRNVGDPYLD